MLHIHPSHLVWATELLYKHRFVVENITKHYNNFPKTYYEQMVSVRFFSFYFSVLFFTYIHITPPSLSWSISRYMTFFLPQLFIFFLRKEISRQRSCPYFYTSIIPHFMKLSILNFNILFRILSFLYFLISIV